jgi:hypothetical protein
MLSKEEMLAKRIIVFPSTDDMTDEDIKHNVFKVMDEHTKQMCMAYGHWLLMRIFPSFAHRSDECLELSKEELYQIFIQSLNTNQMPDENENDEVEVSSNPTVPLPPPPPPPSQTSSESIETSPNKKTAAAKKP